VIIRLVAVCVFAFASAALAQEPDPKSFYELSTAGTSTAVKLGEKGKVVIEITAKAGAHVSADAPLSIKLSGKNAKPEKESLKLGDSVNRPKPGEEYMNARFEVPFAVETVGKANVDAKLKFFICTDKVCSRQEKAFSFPVDVT
jgi:hypothetical protein